MNADSPTAYLAPRTAVAPISSSELHKTGLLWTVCTLVLLIYFTVFKLNYTPPLLYGVCISAIYFSATPRYLMSPRNILFAYHIIFYGIAVIGAERYEQFDFTDRNVTVSYLMLAISYVVSYLTLFHVENHVFQDNFVFRFCQGGLRGIWHLRVQAVAAAVLSIALAFMMITKTGGLAHWIRDPGAAFLHREGAGIYYILFVMACTLAATCIGANASKGGSKALVFLYFLVLLLMTPLLGGKQRVFTTIAYMFLPWIFFAKTHSRRTLYVVSAFLISFTAINWLRNMHWIQAADMLAYSLNYFSTFENLVWSVRDFDPGWLQTTFLPFNKFLTPFGTGNDVVYYDMSNWLTSIYYPNNWEQRCTEQWPVETDLYLSFHFVFGLPLLAAYVAVVGLLYNFACHTKSIGLLLVSAYVTFMLPTHLRGGLIIWTEFYLIPFWIMCVWLLGGETINLKTRTTLVNFQR